MDIIETFIEYCLWLLSKRKEIKAAGKQSSDKKFKKKKLENKYEVKYARGGRVFAAAVSTFCSFHCVEEWYLHDVANHIIRYSEQAENVEYAGIYMYLTNTGDSERTYIKLQNF